ncbi:MAG: phosphate signaling complex protein PhoU [Candidatus Omnitrophica bacterium]|nr:phosphate signaling complex protein PhoU [Candidatus Omnitrophota bacterium]
MSKHFEEELQDLHSDLLKMDAFAEEAIARSVEALREQDARLAQAVIEHDARIDALELVLDERCLDLIARHQPMAKDLRFIATAMRLNSELERIADLAVDIAQRVLELSGSPLLKPLVDIPKLAVLAQTMVKTSIDSFIVKDSELAKKVILMDSEADRLKRLIQNELIQEYIVKDGSVAPRAVPLLLVARHLERICDHATNIAEDVIYLVKGEVVKHHPERISDVKTYADQPSAVNPPEYA